MNVCRFHQFDKACPKDYYSLLNIDNFVDTASSYAILGFCDAFFGYNHIFMWEKDHLKSTFIMDERVFCYKVMPFGLKKHKSHLPENDE